MMCQLACIVLSDNDIEGQRMDPLGKAAILIDMRRHALGGTEHTQQGVSNTDR